MSGTNIGRYHKVSYLGGGSYGNVYACTANGRSYALKSLKLEDVFSNMQEISLLTMMSHPNIAKPIEILPMFDKSRIYIVMPVGHSTLSDAIRSPDRLSEDTIRSIMWQILSALDYMHANGIAHRDLKPGNIIMDGTYIRIIDFGLAHTIIPSSSDTNYSVQTMSHRAPEVFMAQANPTDDNLKRLGLRMDIFSIGIIMYQLFTKRNIYMIGPDWISEKQLQQNIMHLEPYVMDLISKVACSDRAKAVMHGMLQFDPALRSTSSTLMNMEWFKDMHYRMPEYISYPHVTIDYNNDLVKKAYTMMNTHNVLFNCKYSDNILTYALKLITLMIPKMADMTVSFDAMVHILLRIAAMEIDEKQYYINMNASKRTKTDIACTFYGMDSTLLVQTYNIFGALGYNHIVVK